MAYIQKSTPPPNKIQSFTLRNFVGGLNNRSEELADNEASALMNMRFSNESLMENRFGQKYFDGVTIDGEIVFIDEFKPYNAPNLLIKATTSKLYINGVFVCALAGKPTGVNHQGRYYFADGDKLRVYGKFSQASSTHENIIGAPDPNYVLMEIVSPDLGATRLGTAEVEGVLNIDYTNHKVYYVPCENEFTDTYKGANVVPSKIKFLVSHQGRVFATGCNTDDDNVFISDLQRPFYFPVSLPIQMPPNSDKITGIIVYDNSVVVGRQNDIHSIFGMTVDPNLGVQPFQLHKINSHTGFANNDAVKVAHNYLFFLGSDGNCYGMASSKNDEKLLSTTILTKNVDITKDPLNLSLTDISSAVSIFFADEWFLSIKDKVMVYSYLLRQWTVYNNINATSFYIKDNELIWGRSDGRTITWDRVNFLDFGLPFQSYWYSKRFDMGDAISYKQYRQFFLVAHVFDNNPSDINMSFEIDYDDVKDRVVISNRKFIWGKSKWGDRFITRNIAESLPFIIGRRGRSIRFKISCSYFKDGDVATVADLDNYPAKHDGLLVYVTGTNEYYLYNDLQWNIISADDLNQRMMVYQINGDYEFRGKR